jgi:hypothetical protein
MIRTQIQLTEDQYESLRQLAMATERSVADLVREGVDHVLAGRSVPSREELVGRALAAVGRYASGKSDVSGDHDRYLAEAFGE